MNKINENISRRIGGKMSLPPSATQRESGQPASVAIRQRNLVIACDSQFFRDDRAYMSSANDDYAFHSFRPEPIRLCQMDLFPGARTKPERQASF